jgi:hypothetical protein
VTIESAGDCLGAGNPNRCLQLGGCLSLGLPELQNTQKYLHTLPDTEWRNLDALSRIQSKRERSTNGMRSEASLTTSERSTSSRRRDSTLDAVIT